MALLRLKYNNLVLFNCEDTRTEFMVQMSPNNVKYVGYFLLTCMSKFQTPFLYKEWEIERRVMQYSRENH